MLEIVSGNENVKKSMRGVNRVVEFSLDDNLRTLGKVEFQENLFMIVNDEIDMVIKKILFNSHLNFYRVDYNLDYVVFLFSNGLSSMKEERGMQFSYIF